MRLLMRLLLGAAVSMSVWPAFAAVTVSLSLGEPALQAGCGWMLAYDPAVPMAGNTAFPETAARYWTAVVSDSVPAGSRLRIDGQYPDARYSAIHVHDGNMFILDAIADYEIAPLPGSVNRNLSRTGRDDTRPHGGRYTAYVRINAAIPAAREANTVYRQPPALLDGKAKRRTLVAYRTYLAVGGNEGGVPLPQLTLETPDGRQTALPHADDAAACAILRERLIRSSGSELTYSPLLPLIPDRFPGFHKFDTRIMTTLHLGVGYNPHSGFMLSKGDSSYGDVLLVRGKLPSYTTQPMGVAAPQLRYWSLCENGAISTMVYGCLSDRDVALDTFGYYTVAISGDAARPTVLAPALGFSWLNWGPERISAVLIRELLASADFANAIVNAPSTLPALTVTARGEYMPLATYCSRATLQRFAPYGAAVAFQACQRAMLDGVPAT